MRQPGVNRNSGVWSLVTGAVAGSVLLCIIATARLALGTTVDPWSNPEDCSALVKGVPQNDYRIAQLAEAYRAGHNSFNPFEFDVDSFSLDKIDDVESVTDALWLIFPVAERAFHNANRDGLSSSLKRMEELGKILAPLSEEALRGARFQAFIYEQQAEAGYRLWLLNGDTGALGQSREALETADTLVQKLRVRVQEIGVSSGYHPSEIDLIKESIDLEKVKVLSAVAMQTSDVELFEQTRIILNATGATILRDTGVDPSDYQSLSTELVGLHPAQRSRVVRAAFYQSLVRARKAGMARDLEQLGQAASDFGNLAKAMDGTCHSLDRGLASYYRGVIYERILAGKSTTSGVYARAERSLGSAFKDLRYEISPALFARTMRAYGDLMETTNELFRDNLVIEGMTGLKAIEAVDLSEIILGPRVKSMELDKWQIR